MADSIPGCQNVAGCITAYSWHNRRLLDAVETACARNAIGWAMDVFGGRTSGRVEDDNVLWEAETIANLPALGVPLSRYLACRRDAFFLVALIWQACGA